MIIFWPEGIHQDIEEANKKNQQKADTGKIRR
jgi:hypothetical protein